MAKVVIVQREGYPPQAAFSVEQLAKTTQTNGFDTWLRDFIIKRFNSCDIEQVAKFLSESQDTIKLQILEYDNVPSHGLAR